MVSYISNEPHNEVTDELRESVQRETIGGIDE